MSEADAPGARATPGQTPWQTVGPFFHYGLPWKGGADLVGQSDLGARPELFPEAHYVLNFSHPKGEVRGERIEIAGAVLDGQGRPVPDAMIEIWQADSLGRYAAPQDHREGPRDEAFVGFGRSTTTRDGEFRFLTVRPGATPGPGGAPQAPHVAVSVFGRGLLKRLVTRIYFEDEPANAEDPVLRLVPEARRSTLLARRTTSGVHRFDIRLQGERETVFFEI